MPVPIVLAGEIDAGVTFEDGTNSVLDFKSVFAAEAHVSGYARQLHAYAWAVERSALTRPVRVDGLAIVCFEPRGGLGDVATLLESPAVVAIERDDWAFQRVLRDLSVLLFQEEPPPPSSDCQFCRAAA
jgi:hypothetical protein